MRESCGFGLGGRKASSARGGERFAGCCFGKGRVIGGIGGSVVAVFEV